MTTRFLRSRTPFLAAALTLGLVVTLTGCDDDPAPGSDAAAEIGADTPVTTDSDAKAEVTPDAEVNETAEECGDKPESLCCCDFDVLVAAVCDQGSWTCPASASHQFTCDDPSACMGPPIDPGPEVLLTDGEPLNDADIAEASPEVGPEAGPETGLETLDDAEVGPDADAETTAPDADAETSGCGPKPDSLCCCEIDAVVPALCTADQWVCPATAAYSFDCNDTSACYGFPPEPPLDTSEPDSGETDSDETDADETDSDDGGPAADPFAAFSDEFNDPSSLPQWSDYDPAAYTVADVDSSTAGALTVRPAYTPNAGWYANGTGPFFYKTVPSGNFVVQVHAVAAAQGDVTQPPAASSTYNSAGIVVRHPESVPGDQDWMMYNVGRQGTTPGQWEVPPPNGVYNPAPLGSETKRTIGSSSVLELRYAEAHGGQLALCKIGDDLRMYRRLDGETDWTLDREYVGQTYLTSAPSLQVGLVVNAWTNANVEGVFDWIRFAAVTSWADCTASLAP